MTTIKKLTIDGQEMEIEPVQATTEQIGGVKPDGETILISDDGTISTATENEKNEWVYTEAEDIDIPEDNIKKAESCVYDLRNYLPDDGNNYMLQIALEGHHGTEALSYSSQIKLTTTSQYIINKIGWVNSTIHYSSKNGYMGSDYIQPFSCRFFVPVDSERTFRVANEGTADKAYIDKIQLIAYKKI